MELEHYEKLTPKQIREKYGLEIDEDLEKYVKNINLQSKGRKIEIIHKKGGVKNDWGVYELKWNSAIIRNAEISVQC